MATNPLSGVYNGGAVVFNTQPIMQYYTQMLAHKQAKDEALGKYYQDLGKNINSAGMRTQDIENGWNQKVADWQNYYNQNAEKIKYPNKYGAQYQNEFQARYRDILNDVSRSKEAAQNEATVRPKMLDPKWRQSATDDDMRIAQNMGRSIYDPNHYKDGHTTPYGVQDFSFNAPDFDTPKQKAALDFLTHGLIRGEQPHPSKQPIINRAARTITTPMISGYDKPTYDTIVEKGAQLYQGDKSAQRFFENEMHNPADLQQLNSSFRRYFGKDISSPQDVARAWVLQNVPQQIAGKDKVSHWSDPNEALSREMQMYDYRENRKEAKKNEDDANIENFLQTIEADAKKGGNAPYVPAGQEPITAYKVRLTPELQSIFTKTVGAHRVTPDEVRVTENGDYLPIYFEKDDKGVPVGSNGTYAVSKAIPTQAVSREAVKASLAKKLPNRVIKQVGVNQKTQKKNDPLGLF